MTDLAPQYRELCIHGLAMELACAVEGLLGPLDHYLRPFVVEALPEGFARSSGMIQAFDEAEVLRHLSSHATRLPVADSWMQLYRDGERMWLVDERWGMAELNFLRSQWQSWVLPRPTIHPLRLLEAAVLWPAAQLLRPRGLHLLPAASVARDGWGVLIICPFTIEPELEFPVGAGARLIGQRWTAARFDDGRVELLHMPGMVERSLPPRLRQPMLDCSEQWVDVTADDPQAIVNHGFCDFVLLVEPGRRTRAAVQELSRAEAQEALRFAWPILEVHPTRRSGALSCRLAQTCRCAQVQLSRKPGDLMALIDSMIATAPAAAPSLTLFTRQPHRRAEAMPA